MTTEETKRSMTSTLEPKRNRRYKWVVGRWGHMERTKRQGRDMKRFLTFLSFCIVFAYYRETSRTFYTSESWC